MANQEENRPEDRENPETPDISELREGFVSGQGEVPAMSLEQAREVLARHEAEQAEFRKREEQEKQAREEKVPAGKIMVQPRADWMRQALAGREFGAVNGENYRLDQNAVAVLPDDSGQETHPDWELVAGLPKPRVVNRETGEKVPERGRLRWVQIRHRGHYGTTVKGPAPMNFPAQFNALGLAAVPDNSGFGDHPDYVWQEYLTPEEAAAEKERRGVARAGAEGDPVALRQQDAAEEARVRDLVQRMQSGVGVAAGPGFMAQMRDPNSTGIPGVMRPPQGPPTPPPPLAGPTPTEQEESLDAEIVKTRQAEADALAARLRGDMESATTGVRGPLGPGYGQTPNPPFGTQPEVPPIAPPVANTALLEEQAADRAHSTTQQVPESVEPVDEGVYYDEDESPPVVEAAENWPHPATAEGEGAGRKPTSNQNPASASRSERRRRAQAAARQAAGQPPAQPEDTGTEADQKLGVHGDASH